VLATPEYYHLTANTPLACTTLCASRGFALAAVEYTDECFCSNTYANALPPAPAPASFCNMPCAGDPTQTCGGGYLMQIYESITVPISAALLPLGWVPTMPCAVDTIDRVFADTKSVSLTNTTPSRCISACAVRPFTLLFHHYRY
jgi:hypothetical protein